MTDAAHEWTSREINRLSRQLGRVYSKAHAEAEKRYVKALESYARERSQRLKALDGSKEMQDAFDAWCRRESLKIAQDKRIAEQLAYDLTMTDVKAREIADGVLAGVYAKNYNHTIGDIGKQLGNIPEGTGVSFAMVDEQTVRKLVTENPRLLPMRSTVREGTPEYARAMAYNRRQVTTAITQGILQGEPIPDIAKRIGGVYGKGANAATRYARTACTYAENAGRLEGFKTAESIGIKLVKEWRATGDERTRDTHLEADGQQVPVDEPFKVGDAELMEPGDPSGDPGEVWNCRCTMRGRVEGFDESEAHKAHDAEIGAERDRRLAQQSGEGDAGGLAAKIEGMRLEGEFDRDEWVDIHQAQFDNIDEIRKMGEEQISALTSEERDAVSTYTGNAYSWMNEHKRTGTVLDGSRQQIIEQLDSAMEKSTLRESVVTVRGTKESCLRDIYEKVGEVAAKEDPSILIGEIFQDKAFLSTTMEPTPSFSGAVRFHIMLPEGTHAIYVESISHFEDELEMLVQSGQPFLIRDAAYERGRWSIFMEAIV